MRIFISFFFIYYLFLTPSYPQDSKTTPEVTLKIGLNISAIYGSDFRDELYKGSFFFQPGISGGVLFRNWIYLGIYGSRYCCFKYSSAYDHNRNILAGEIGLPIKNFIIGFSVGNEKYSSPWKGNLPTEHEYKTLFIGVFVDYWIFKYISMPLRIAFSEDPSSDGLGNYWHFTIGVTGNLPISKNVDN